MSRFRVPCLSRNRQPGSAGPRAVYTYGDAPPRNRKVATGENRHYVYCAIPLPEAGCCLAQLFEPGLKVGCRCRKKSGSIMVKQPEQAPLLGPDLLGGKWWRRRRSKNISQDLC